MVVGKVPIFLRNGSLNSETGEVSEIEKLHDCEQSHGKIVCIEADKLGNTYCGYCHKRVDYSKLHNEDFKKFKKRLQEDSPLIKDMKKNGWKIRRKK